MSRINGLLDLVGGLMSKSLHNYTVATLLILEAVSVATVLICPNAIRLDMAKDVGVVLLGALGIVGGVHYGKERARLGVPGYGNGGGDPPARLGE